MTAKAGTALMTFCIHYFESSLVGQFKTAKLISVEQILTYLQILVYCRGTSVHTGNITKWENECYIFKRWTSHHVLFSAALV